MFEVGFSEIVLILGLALLVLGPEKLPGLAQKVGRWTGRARAMARQLRTQLEQEVTLEEMAKSKPMHTPKQEEPTPSTEGPSTEGHADNHSGGPYSGGLDTDALSGHDTSVPAPGPTEPSTMATAEVPHPHSTPAGEPAHTKVTQ